jgi:ribosomal-protein-alanine N-acetyltransferase
VAAQPEPAPVELRELTLRDVGAIEEIERASYPTPWSRAMFASELAKPSSICVGAFRDGDLLGYMIISRYVDAWHVMNIAVAPQARRQGVATMLLEVRVSNLEAIRLYERIGFRQRGVRRGYYTDNREDALIMWKDPLPGSGADA